MTKLMWHFVAANGKLGYNDGRVVEAGKKYTVDCAPVLCNAGLHASERIIDALQYAPGPLLCKVKLGGEVIHGEDKAVGTERTVVAMADASDVLRQFSREIAYEVWAKYFATDPENVVVKWLKTGDESLRSAARSAAWSAAWSAAESAAESAARSAQNKKLLALVRKLEWKTK